MSHVSTRGLQGISRRIPGNASLYLRSAQIQDGISSSRGRWLVGWLVGARVTSVYRIFTSAKFPTKLGANFRLTGGTLLADESVALNGPLN